MIKRQIKKYKKNFLLLWVSADLAVNLDESLLEDGLNLLGGQCVLQTVPGNEKNNSALLGKCD